LHTLFLAVLHASTFFQAKLLQSDVVVQKHKESQIHV